MSFKVGNQNLIGFKNVETEKPETKVITSESPTTNLQKSQIEKLTNHLSQNINNTTENTSPNTPKDFLQKVLSEQPFTIQDANAKKEVITVKLNKSSEQMSKDDYNFAFRKAVYQKAVGMSLTDEEVKLADQALKDAKLYSPNYDLRGTLTNLQNFQKRAGNEIPIEVGKENLERANRAGQAILQYKEFKAKELDAAIEKGKNYATDAMGGFVQPIVNGFSNLGNGLTEPFRAGERVMFGTNYIPEIPRMTVAERSEYWNKDGRMYANRIGEFGATLTFGGIVGAKALATQGGRILLATEATYNIGAGIAGKDITQTDADGNPREMSNLERGMRITGGLFGARQTIKTEINTPNSAMNRLDDIFKPKPPRFTFGNEALTDIGLKVKVPNTEEIKGSNLLESRANGFPNQRIPSSDGEWTGKIGESGWKSNKPEVIAVTGGKEVPFKKGYPVFDEWVRKIDGIKGEIKLPKMKGNHDTDFSDADKLFAKKLGWFKKDGVTLDGRRTEQLRETQNLTWHHHQDKTTMQLVPKDLNNKVPHTGGASLVKKGS